MLEQLAFALVAVALAAPILLPLLWSQLGQSSQDQAAVTQDERTSGQRAAKSQPLSASAVPVSQLVDRRQADAARRIAGDPSLRGRNARPTRRRTSKDTPRSSPSG